jgi:preprotein translocase subunit YajC
MHNHRKLFLWVMSLVFGAFCFSTSSAQTDENKEKASMQSVTGCLQKGDEPGGFTIAGDDGKVWELQSKKVKLSDHVGHTVTVTGSVAKGSQSTEDKMESSEKKEAAGKEYSDLKVYSLKMVSDSCK